MNPLCLYIEAALPGLLNGKPSRLLPSIPTPSASKGPKAALLAAAPRPHTQGQGDARHTYPGALGPRRRQILLANY